MKENYQVLFKVPLHLAKNSQWHQSIRNCGPITVSEQLNEEPCLFFDRNGIDYIGNLNTKAVRLRLFHRMNQNLNFCSTNTLPKIVPIYSNETPRKHIGCIRQIIF